MRGDTGTDAGEAVLKAEFGHQVVPGLEVSVDVEELLEFVPREDQVQDLGDWAKFLFLVDRFIVFPGNDVDPACELLRYPDQEL